MARKSLLFGFAIAKSVRAADVGYYISSSCIDPSGFSSCYSNANSSYTDCVNSNCENQSIDCINACECVRSTDYIDCAASSCWNQVYSCEYQLTVSDFINFCVNPDLTTIPYWPPPDNAPIGCSCPIGKVQLSILSDVAHLDMCTNNQTNLDELLSEDDIANYVDACTCCYQSGILSAIYDICPSTLPSLLGADTYFDSLFTDTDWESCSVYLKAYNCTSELGFSSPAGNMTDYYGPGDFPGNGTLDLFDTKGEGEMRTPASGSVFTWTANGVARTVSAVGVTGSVIGGASATAAETGSGTTTLAASTPSDTSAASVFEVGLWRLFVVSAAMLVF
ncbi:uncharacterized protein LY89DRAFT_735322 [Mollisia scopiformis]|uniref:Uncharacterized protein n=1 Tax=Mollisia scopiformis TaxID=149040 RepID=A0A194X4T8_MOLSC|nr:uncharacterized protein LY89DRAFT_735322 [Mollisia scopiformis]KUJ15191.1 hypothetical protein LY89DRAFT_735322 [Mollisia scopiformis]